MRIDQIKPNKKYEQTKATDERKPGTRDRMPIKVTHYVLQVDIEGGRVLSSLNGAPATWLTGRNTRYWKEAAAPPKFDIDRIDLYMVDDEFKERTKERLVRMAELGMEETGLASFGYKGVMSGLYIEMVWRYTDKEFDDYMNWAGDLIKKKAS